MTSQATHPHGAEILIAEDSPTQAERLRYLLEGSGYRVRSMPNGRLALEEARRSKPAMIISDVMMPEMDGFTLCREIKQDELLRDVPVILLTSLSDIGDIMQGLECGADHFIRKPYEDHYLLTRVEYLLINQSLRKGQKTRIGMEIYLGGQRHFITAERQQIVDLLISVYEEAIHINKELHARQLELAHSNHLLTGLYRIAEGLNRAVNEHEVCDKALDHVVELPGIDAGWLYLWEQDGTRTTATRGIPDTPALREAMERLGERQRGLLAEGTSHAAGIDRDALSMPLGNALPGFGCHAGIPLWINNQYRGVLNLAGARQEPFGNHELETFQGVGHQIGITLERARLHAHMEQLVEARTAALTAEISRRKEYEIRIIRLNRIYSVLSGINNTIVRVRSQQELFDKACHIATSDGKFLFAWIGLFDADAQRIDPMAKAGDNDGFLSRIDLTDAGTPGDSWLIAEAIRWTKPAICNDLTVVIHDPMRAWHATALERGYRSEVILPLVVDGRLEGVFALYASETGCFDEEEMTLLTEMAGDISFAMDHLKKEERINYLAFFDAITDLPNRALFLDRVDQRIGTLRDSREILSVILLDIERFSSINESLGHQSGDDLLRQLGKRLILLLDETDVLAHLSADHFAIAIRHAEGSTDIVHVLEKLLLGIQDQPFQIGTHELRISARAGASSYPADGRNTDTLLRNAETALKKAKLSYDKYLFYAPEFNARVTEKLKLETKLRRAIKEGQLVLHYQPKIDLGSGKISGLEALMRWQDPHNGLVPPLHFIPLLEETRLILDAGRWALSKAIEDSQTWKSLALDPPKIAVNVSPIQLRQKDFVSMVASVIHGARGADIELELEITESVIMQDIETNIQKLRIIRDMHIEVAIDDFGTGYSSLSYIAKLPVNVLKIDRAFIINMTSNPDDLHIVSAIISLAHSLNLKVIAEGVETREQADLLRKLACDEIQGYLFSPGVPAKKIEEFLSRKTTLQ
ncbi:EAL domain-containing protein [Nitrosovibrio sp. Nv17]|uniref:EAL domain-containing protein n=1 Tax=Nitrosovibrio sp. Nv17 TaxID=1855339 RepID=UPI000908DA16|nr:EAL domain-containing protein [Nitrosovibrio sp. Nv17]SFW30506.1 diguanylate cyclase (GGDEF) domain-containing protein [Nitrosovibrio sp. Nv17]